MRLFRQKQPGDWDEVFERITREVEKAVFSFQTGERGA